ncbi:MAG: chorismate lyase [Motiliproteus sp.]|nr:chorismate lyase [Motiliproteus sp.]MCW9052293.1 chorismate lyase [Motiliproteus sp.]
MPTHKALTSPSVRTRWQAYRRVPSIRLSRKWRQWLLDPGSLTARLVELSNNNFHVEVAFQGWGKPTLSEARALNIHPRQQVLIREVRLCGHGEPWVYARSVIPSSTLNGPLRILKTLGNKPLGALLFKDPTMKRKALETAVIPLTHEKSEAWARRSVFLLRNQPLLVTEVFLKPLLQVQ